MVEYSLAVVLIGLAAIVVTSFVGKATSGVFDEVGNAFVAESIAAPLAVDAPPDVFDELLERIEDIDGPGKSLRGKAEDAESSYLAGDSAGAIGKLDSLIKEVNAQDGKQLTAPEAAAVRNAAQELIEAIGPG